MNQESKAFYDSAYDSLKDGKSASYVQTSGGTYDVATSEVTATTTTSTPITIYQDSPSTKDIEKGLASVTDIKVLVAAKAMPLVTPKIDDTIVLSEYTITVKQLDPVKSLEGITVLHQLFCSKMA